MDMPQMPTTHSALTITALAARHAQLTETPTAGVLDKIMAEQKALDERMLYSEPMTPDGTLTLLQLVWEEIDEDDPLAGALERVCRALERDGSRNLRYS